MKILLHIGQSKTGTTALQASLSAASEELRGQGIYYPLVGKGKGVHHFLSFLFYQSPDHARFMIGRAFKDFDEALEQAKLALGSVKNACQKQPPEVLILSSETLSGTLCENLKGVPSGLLKDLSEDVQPILYLRNPADRYFSNVQELIKSGKPIYNVHPLEIRSTIESYEKEFGKRVDVLPFSKTHLTNGDIVQDFTSRYLSDRMADTTCIETIVANETISAACMSLMLDFSQHLKYDQNTVRPFRREIGRYLRLIREYDRDNGLYQRPVLKQEVRDQIIRASTELLWLRDERGIEFEEIDYDTIDGERGSLFNKRDLSIGDLCEVDEKVKKEIGAHVLAKLLASGKKGPSGKKEPARRSPFGFKETWNALPRDQTGLRKVWAFVSRRAANIKKRLSLRS